MSSEDEDYELNYGLEEEYQKSLRSQQDYLNPLDEDYEEDEEQSKQPDQEFYVLPRYTKNPKTNDENNDKEEKENEDNEECRIEELLDLMEKSTDADNDELCDSKDDVPKKEVNDSKIESKKIHEQVESIEKSSPPKKSTSSITITKINRDPLTITEKNTGIRILKSEFTDENEMNSRLVCDYGKFYKLTELSRRCNEIKEKGSSYDWFTIFIIGSKTETKTSARGNNYVIWDIVDLGNLERQLEVTLFLFGNAYQSHWKANEFDVFALVKPEFLASRNNNQAAPASTNYSHDSKKQSNWNKFASKKINEANKQSLSVNNEKQLFYLGAAKDISNCKYIPKTASESGNHRKCKNLVNTERAPFCVMHCAKMDKKSSFKNIEKGRFQMIGEQESSPKVVSSPTSRRCDFPTYSSGKQELFSKGFLSSPANRRFDFPESNHTPFSPQPLGVKPAENKRVNDVDLKAKMAKDYKAQVINSLSLNIAYEAAKSSPVLANILVKTNKKTDMELLASLEGKELDKEEIRKVRLEQQAAGSVIYSHSKMENLAINKEIKAAFNSKILLPNENNCNHSISSIKMVELKKSMASMSEKEFEEKMNKNKNHVLSSMKSHRDIVKQIKKSKDDKDDKEDKEDKEESAKKEQQKPNKEPSLPTNNFLVKNLTASDLLKKRMEEIKSNPNLKSLDTPKLGQSPKPGLKRPATAPKLSNPADQQPTFDLELYIGDSVTTKKLLDAESKYVPFSKIESYKRKADDSEDKSIQSAPAEDTKAKRAKMIDEILSVKSSHLKDANNPDKNPQLKAYYDRLENQEKIDDVLASTKNRDVHVITCNTCKYTAFKQSDFCKLKKHEIKRHMVLQRFFKCKACNTRTYTLDQLYPTSSCKQCKESKFEPCGMKDSVVDKKADLSTPNLDQESEMLLNNS